LDRIAGFCHSNQLSYITFVDLSFWFSLANVMVMFVIHTVSGTFNLDVHKPVKSFPSHLGPLGGTDRRHQLILRDHTHGV